jgi:pyruvate,water dikinase
VARFQELMEVTSSYVAVREVRALWQMNAAGSLRAALLRYGNRLTTNSVIADPEDIFFLLPNEIDANLTEDGNSLKSLVEERRRDWEMWRTKQPPVGIGSAYATAVPTESTSEAQPDEMVIRGAGASKGKVTARAKIIHDLSEADKLESGDVLVCVASSPPWTILFTKASAVVTDTGSVLSHPAIASREYGIPCVVATGNATERIRDGMIVTVDGSEGTVRIEG